MYDFFRIKCNGILHFYLAGPLKIMISHNEISKVPYNFNFNPYNKCVYTNTIKKYLCTYIKILNIMKNTYEQYRKSNICCLCIYYNHN